VKKEAAEQFTSGLSKLFEGTHEQIIWGRDNGVPKALGLSEDEWFKSLPRPKLEPARRREIVIELREKGESQRTIGKVLGVDKRTIARDLDDGANAPLNKPKPAETLEPDDGYGANAPLNKPKPAETVEPADDDGANAPPADAEKTPEQKVKDIQDRIMQEKTEKALKSLNTSWSRATDDARSTFLKSVKNWKPL
jgi:hypothetical protein